MVRVPNKITAGEVIKIESPYEVVSLVISAKEKREFTSTSGTLSISTTSFSAGLHAFELWGYNGDDAKLIQQGTINVSASLRLSEPGEDHRSTAQKVVENIESYLETGKALIKEYEINNRRLERHSISELLELLRYYKLVLQRERRRAAGRSTLGKSYKYKL